MTEKQQRFDVQGYDIITDAIQNLLDAFPGLEEGEEILFSSMKEESGFAWYPISGGVIEDEKCSVTGKVKQTCAYPFFLIYRSGATSPKRKAGIKEFLDSIGRWLEKQPVKVGEDTVVLKEYPSLTEGRSIKTIERQTPAYLDNETENKIEDWVIYITLKYQNEFRRGD